MNRYIDANKYEQELRRMIEIVHETGHAPGISGELVIPLRVSYLAGAEAAIKSLAIYREHEEAKKPKTNADRIRQMTDDELAEMVSMKVCRIVKPDGKDCPKGFYFGKCDKCVLAWLKQEVNEDAPAVNRWIPYSEKRPDLWGEYLTYNAENGAMYVLSFSPADNTFGIYDGNVTHWMPLPEPPKE